jgi:hypothetical protein
MKKNLVDLYHVYNQTDYFDIMFKCGYCWHGNEEININRNTLKIIDAIRTVLKSNNITTRAKGTLCVFSMLVHNSISLGYRGFSYNLSSIDSIRNCSYKSFVWLTDVLESLGYINVYKGFIDHNTGVKSSSLVELNNNLIVMLGQYKTINMDKSYGCHDLIFEDRSGNYIYRSDNNISSLRSFINSYDICFTGYSDEQYKITFDLYRKYKKDKDTYGRLYFRSQNIPRQLRRSLTIHGNRCSEVDYVSNHVNILYELDGVVKPSNFDPYCADISSIEGVNVLDKDNLSVVLRDINKVSIMCLLSSRSAHSSLYNHYRWSNIVSIDSLSAANKIIKENEKVVSDLKHHFRKKSNSGYLQNIDSNIAMNIMGLMKSEGLPCLPYHDSFVCMQHHKDYLIKFMEVSWRNILGSSNNFKYKIKF